MPIDDMRKGKVLVTGGAGYIGSACVRALCDRGYEIAVLDSLASGSRDYVDTRAEFFEGDVQDEATVRDVFEAALPETVIHMAALKAVGESEKEPERYFRNNVIGTLNVLSAGSAYGMKRIIFSSTATVYRPKEEGLYGETDALESSNAYGNSKLMAEKLIQEFHRLGKVPSYAVFRYFNVAGDAGLGFVEKDPQNLLPAILASVKGKKAFQIFGDDYPTADGTCVRDYIHISDVVDAHLNVMEKDVSGIYNLGTSKGTSVLEMLAAFEHVTGIAVPYEIRERRQGDPAILRAVPKKVEAELDFRPTRSLEDMLSSLRVPIA